MACARPRRAGCPTPCPRPSWPAARRSRRRRRPVSPSRTPPRSAGPRRRRRRRAPQRQGGACSRAAPGRRRARFAGALRDPLDLRVGRRRGPRTLEVTSSAETARNEAASARSATWTPAAATRRPASAGPAAAPAVKPMLSTAFPSRRSPAGFSRPGGRARAGPGRRGERAVDRGEGEHRRQQELVRQQRQGAEDRRLGRIEHRQGAAGLQVSMRATNGGSSSAGRN